MTAMQVQAPDGRDLEFDVLSVEEAIARAVEEFDLPRRTMDNRLLVWTVRQDGTVLRTGPPTPGTWTLDAEGGPEAIAEIDEAVREVKDALSAGEAAQTPHLMTKLTLLRRTGARERELDELDEAVRGARREDTRGQRSRQRSALALPLIGGLGVVAVGVLVFISLSGNVDRPDPVFEPDVIEGLPAVIDGEISVRGEVDEFEIDLEAGEGIEIRMIGASAFQEMDTELRVRGPNGNEVAYNDDFNGLNSRIVYVATEAGTHVIEAGGLGGCCVGAYQLTVDPIDGEGLQAVDTDVELPFEGEGTIGLQGVYDRYRVTMAAGEAFSAQAFGGIGGFGGQFDMEMRVYDEDFFQLAYNDDWNGLDPRIDWIAATDGVYIVEVGALGGQNVGDYRIQIDPIDPDDAQQDPFFGEDGFDGGFEGDFGDQFLGDSISGVDFGSYEGGIIEFGEYDEYSLELVESQAIRVSMDALGGNLDPHLRVYDETGAIVAENDDFNGLNSRVDYVAPDAGVYTIRAAGLAGGSTGEYVLTIEEIDPGDAGRGDGGFADEVSVVEVLPFSWPGNLSTAGEYDVFDIGLTAGQAIRIQLQAGEVGGLDPYLVLRDAATGQELASNDDFAGLDSQLDFVAPYDAVFTIEARSLGNCCSGDFFLQIDEIDPAEVG